MLDSAKSAAESQNIQAEERIALLAKEKQQLQDLQDLYNYNKKQSEGGPGTGALTGDQSAVMAIIGGRAQSTTKMGLQHVGGMILPHIPGIGARCPRRPSSGLPC